MFITNWKNLFQKIPTLGAAAYNEFGYKKYPSTTSGLFLALLKCLMTMSTCFKGQFPLHFFTRCKRDSVYVYFEIDVHVHLDFRRCHDSILRKS